MIFYKIMLDIRELSLEELIKEVDTLGEKPFRAKQVYEWLWNRNPEKKCLTISLLLRTS